MGALPEPFHLDIPQPVLDELLHQTRWPEFKTVNDWSQGEPLGAAQALCSYWRDRYDGLRCEAMLNVFSQFRNALDGLNIHFLHVRPPEPHALPLILSHGWPGSVIEFHKVIGPLTNPVAHDGNPTDAFHDVAPSLPAYGFSDHPAETGWSVKRIARAWIELMRALGYARFVAQIRQCFR